jgi:hypothetical protein
MEDWDHHQSETTRLAGDVCTECNSLSADLLELDGNHLHCSLKVLLRGETSEDDVVATWMRSEPYDGRSGFPSPDTHRVSENSVWCALLGRYDGNFNWKNPFCCFACNDLIEHGSEFRCSRDRWQDYYRSTLVFPLRYLSQANGERKYNVIGFLAFDSPNKNAFARVPDIFDYRDRPDKIADYNTKLSAAAVFQIGAVMADTLSMFLRPAYDKHAGRREI